MADENPEKEDPPEEARQEEREEEPGEGFWADDGSDSQDDASPATDAGPGEDAGADPTAPASEGAIDLGELADEGTADAPDRASEPAGFDLSDVDPAQDPDAEGGGRGPDRAVDGPDRGADVGGPDSGTDRPAEDASDDGSAGDAPTDRSPGDVPGGDVADRDSAAPLSDLAASVGERRARREERDPESDPETELFEEVAVEEVDTEAVWADLDTGEPTGEAGPDIVPDDAAERVGEEEDRLEHVVPKREYCHRCPYFAEPPDAVCEHEGTDIVEVLEFDEFRVRGCPMVGNEAELGGVD